MTPPIQQWILVELDGAHVFEDKGAALNAALARAGTTQGITVRGPGGQEWLVVRRDPHVTIVTQREL